MTKTEQTEEKQKDILPDVVDDGDLLVSEPARQDADDPGSAAKAELAEEKTQPEDPRAAIARRFRENRDREKAAGVEEAASAEVVAKAEPEAKIAEPAPAARPQPAQDEEEFTLKINGREVKKTRSEVIAMAQKDWAADNKFEEATRLLEEARAVRQTAKPEHPPAAVEEPQQHDQTPKDKAAREHQPKQALDPGKLKGIVERIQVGDSEEGVQALQELVEMTRGGSADLSPEQIGTMVKQHLIETQTTDEINSALANFVKEFPDMAKNELLADAGRTALRQELIKDLKSIGADDADIDKIKHDPRALASAQRQLRAAGHKVRSYGEILGAVGKTMTDTFNLKPLSGQQNIPLPTIKTPPQREAAPSQDRLNRKLAATQQPRAAGVRGNLQPAPRPKSNQDIVDGMRKARGFPSTR